MTIGLALLGDSQGRLHDVSNTDIDMTMLDLEDRNSDLEPALIPHDTTNQDRMLAKQCDASLKCENNSGFDGYTLHGRTLFLGLFGAGCINKCVANSKQKLYQDVFGFKCGNCGP